MAHIRQSRPYSGLSFQGKAVKTVPVVPSSLGSGGCEDRVLDGPALGEKGSKGRNQLDCIRGKGVRVGGNCLAERGTCSTRYEMQSGSSAATSRIATNRMSPLSPASVQLSI